MNRSTCIVIGSCFVLQALPDFNSRGAEALERSALSGQENGSAATLNFARNPASSMSNGEASDLLTATARPLRRSQSQRLELEIFVQKRTKELLPERYSDSSVFVAQAVMKAAKRYSMDPLFVMALIQHESRFNPDSVGSHGEIGLMQIKPSTALWLIKDAGMFSFSDLQDESLIQEALKDPEFNIAIGTAYLARLRNDFKNHGLVYLSAYNMGSVNAKSLLRQGNHPRIYSDLVVNEFVSLKLDFATTHAANGRHVASYHHLPSY